MFKVRSEAEIGHATMLDPTELNPTKPRILIVEDEGIIACDIQRILVKLGYDFYGPAWTGAEAMAALERSSADVVLMDIMIRGEIDGVETAEQIRRRFRTPVIFLTAHDDSSTLNRATKTSPYGYVVKPFTESSLRVAIELALSRRRLEREAQARQDWLHAALESIADAAIATKGVDGCVEYLNQMAEELTGWSTAHAQGRPLSEVLQFASDDTRSTLDMLTSGQPLDRQVESFEATLRTRTGDFKKVAGSAGPLQISEGPEGVGLVMVLKLHSDELARQATKETDARGELEQLSHALTHDLREPVRNMACFAQMLLRQSSLRALDADSQEYLQFIVDGSKRMDELLIGLFRYHCANDKIVEPNAKANSATAWADAIKSMSRQLRLSGALVQVIGSLPLVGMDSISLHDIFEALLSNAMRFQSGQHPPFIKVEAQRDGSFWRFTIEDNGLGLEFSQTERVFGLFKKAHRPGLSGAGIGLAICRRLVELYGGRIWLESRPGQGTRASFTVPASPQPGSSV